MIKKINHTTAPKNITFIDIFASKLPIIKFHNMKNWRGQLRLNRQFFELISLADYLFFKIKERISKSKSMITQRNTNYRINKFIIEDILLSELKDGVNVGIEMILYAITNNISELFVDIIISESGIKRKLSLRLGVYSTIYETKINLYKSIYKKIDHKGTLKHDESNSRNDGLGNKSIFIAPSIKSQVRYLLLQTQFFSIKFLKRLIGKGKYIWEIGYFDIRNSNKINYIQNPPNSFLADPFPVVLNEKLYIFCEKYDGIKKKGEIAVIICTEKKYNVHTIISEPFHLSFPFVFKYDGVFYMCPESSQITEIRLYKCTEFPNIWNYHQTIIKNINVVDPIIFEHDNLWWLFASEADAVQDDQYINLVIYYGDSPLSADWVRHSMSPVISSTIGGRNAGFYKLNKKMIRVGQVQGSKTYGQKVKYYEILKLTKYLVDIKEVDGYDLSDKLRFSALHTINLESNILTFDFCK
jgi:hypothetical protein